MPRKNHAAQILKDARRLAGISQRTLAQRAGTVQSVVARIELGVASPSVDTLLRLLSAAGFELLPRLGPKPVLSESDLAESARLLRLPVPERLKEPSEVPGLDVERVVAALAWHRVKYVVAGVVAARLQGMPRRPVRLELVPARDVTNLKALAAALRELNPRVHSDAVPAGLGFDCSAETLGRADAWDLVTTAGRVAVVFTPPGLGGLDELLRNGVSVELRTTVVIASLADVARSIAAVDRPEDRPDLFLLEHLISEMVSPR